MAHNTNELGIVYYWYKFYDVEKLFHQLLRGYTANVNINPNSERFIEFYYSMQVIGALSFLLKTNSNREAIFRLKCMLREFLEKLED